jgi:hypothetical protein
MSVGPDVRLERLLHGLERELLEATDEEFKEGAGELGMHPDMKGSAAFLGVKNLSPQLLAVLRHAYRERRDESRDTAPPDPTEPPGRPKRNAGV